MLEYRANNKIQHIKWVIRPCSQVYITCRRSQSSCYNWTNANDILPDVYDAQVQGQPEEDPEAGDQELVLHTLRRIGTGLEV